jgi:uncharacterized membrane protein YbhN (UPF0104 family)
MKRTRKSWWTILVRLILTGAVIGLLLWQIRWRDVLSSAMGMQPGLLLWAILLWIPAHGLQFARWVILARHAGKEATWGDIVRSYWVGFTLAVVTPGRIGQFGRCFALRVPAARAIGVSLLERFYATVVLNGAGPLALAIMILSGAFLPATNWRIPLVVCLCLFGAGMLFLGIVPRALLPALLWIVRRLPLRDKLERMVGVLDGLNSRLTVILLALSLLSTGVALVQFVILLWAMNSAIPLGLGVVAVMVNFFLKANLPISIAGLGVSEWTAVFCLTELGVAPAAAVAGSLVLFAINVLSPALLGIPVLPSLKIPRARTEETPSLMMRWKRKKSGQACEEVLVANKTK